MNPNYIWKRNEASTAWFQYYPSITVKDFIIYKNVLLNACGLKVRARIELFDIVKTTCS
jgi:hypothetical protein